MDFLQTLAEMEEWNGGQGPVEQIAPAPKDMKRTSGKKTLMHMLYRTQAEEEEVTAQHDGLIKFFQDNPNPSEDEMNAFAEEMGTDPDALDERIYALLSSLLKGVGKSNDMSDDEFDPEQLAKGIEEEMEHTEDELIAKMIAKDHLADIPDYYDRLGQMEDEAGDEDNADAEMGGEYDDFEDDDEIEDDLESNEMGDDEEMDLEMGDDEYGDEEDDMTMSDDSEMDDVMDPNYEDDPEGDMDEYDDDDEDEFDDDEMYDDDEDSEYASGDLEDDEFEINLGRKGDVDTEDRPRKKKAKKRVKRLTFKESLMQG